MVYNFRINVNQSRAAIPMVCQIKTRLLLNPVVHQDINRVFKNLQELGVKFQSNEVIKHSESSTSSNNRKRVQSKTIFYCKNNKPFI